MSQVLDLEGWLPACAAAAEADGLAGRGVAVLGVGKAALASALTEAIVRSAPRGVLLFGVAGAFRKSGLQVGEVCVVGTDTFGDEGVLHPGGFTSVAELNLGPVGPFATANVAQQVAERLGCRSVAGVTVSTCSGTDAAADILRLRSGADVETMEGAAAAMVCARFGMPFVQLRAISNFTGDRDRGQWDLTAAVAAVGVAVRSLLR